MNYQPILTMVLIPAVWLLKSIVYVVTFRVRKISATYLSCLIIAGAPLLFGGLIFIPLPDIFAIIGGIGLSVYITMHYTGVPFIPDRLFIPLGIEVAFRIGTWVIQMVRITGF